MSFARSIKNFHELRHRPGATLTPMHYELNALPHDIALLHRMVRELLDTLDAERTERAKLERRIAWLTRQHFGTKSERVPEAQLRLWLEAIEEDAATLGVVLDEPEPAASGARRRAVRKPLPEHLPREVEHLELETTACAGCGGALHLIGEEVSEQLDYRPASFFVRRTVRAKYACRGCDTVLSPEVPTKPIAKGNPGAGLLAHVLVSKYADHQPLYRQSQIFARHDIALSRTTLCGWVAHAARLLAPLAERLKVEVLEAARLHTDDTPVPVLDPGRGRTKTGRLWVYLRPAGPDPPALVYHYTDSHAHAHPQRFLATFEGALHADAFPGYEALYKGGAVREVGCWMHARRPFYELARAGNAPLAAEALTFIRRLYAVEETVRDAEPEARRAHRLAHAAPVLDEFKDWLDEKLARLPPKSELARAMRYLLSRWPSFTRFLDDGRLAIDNGAAARALRAVVLGRKNYLFAGSDAGGERAAVIYSLIETAKLNAVEPFAYLRDVLARLPDHPINRVHELLPYRWHDPANAVASADAA